jgi:S1-C subfamily serine protease
MSADAHSLKHLSRSLEELVARTAPSVVSVAHRRGHGSGFALTPDGYVLTNRHVVHGARDPHVTLAGGARFAARVVGTDAPTDLAVLRVDAPQLPALPLVDSRRVKVGQLVLAIGNPLRFERSVSLGVVSALDRSLPAPDRHVFEGLIQTDAAINPGNSGGPLVDMDGAVVGINTAIVPWAQGIGFAVPAHTAHWVAAVLIHEGEVRRPRLGVGARAVDLLAATARDLEQSRAVAVVEVGRDSPARRAGIREGDLLLRIDDQPLASLDDLQRVLVLGRPEEVRICLLRDGARREVRVRPTPA